MHIISAVSPGGTEMSIPDQYTIVCPYCGETTDIHIDIYGGSEELLEDCTVCCRPIVLHIVCDESGTPSVSAATESE